jgi:hypothetical protein
MLDNIYEKAQILQFCIILFMIEYSNQYTINNEKIEYNKDILLNITNYKKIIFKQHGSIEDLILNNEYFYYFKSPMLNVFFFKKTNSNQHIIFFDGMKKFKDVIDLIINISLESLNHYIFDILNEDGILYDNTLKEYGNINNIFEAFLYIKEMLYKKTEENNVSIYGYSLGGPLSYLFLDILEKNDLIYENDNTEKNDNTDKLNIKITSIESWFEGNKQLYDKIKNKNDFKTIFSKGSFMFLYKNIFQTYIDDYILVESNDEDEIQDKYLMKSFPFGLIQYFKDNHSIDKIIL